MVCSFKGANFLEEEERDTIIWKDLKKGDIIEKKR